MSRLPGVFFFLLILVLSKLTAQESDEKLRAGEWYIDSLAMVLLDNPTRPDSIKSHLMEVLHELSEHPDFSRYPFDNLKALMIVNSSDNLVKVFTGMIRLQSDQVTYYGGIYHEPSSRWIPLEEVKTDFQYFEKEQSEPNNWYGAIYYDLYPFKRKFKTLYVLFGFRSIDRFTALKLADVLSFDNEEVIFGAPVFHDEAKDLTVNRFHLTYASEAPIKLNFDAVENKIVFDHLIPIKSPYDTSRTIMVPDGSYSAYKLKRGKWIFEDKLPVKAVDEAPRDHPILDNRKNRDILGHSTEKNGTDPTPQKENR